MEKIAQLLLCLLFLLIFAVRTLHYIHMFQLNSYKSKVQCKWLLKNAAALWKQSALLLLGPVLPLVLPNRLASTVALLVVYAVTLVLNLPPKAKKPLVYTKRVIRLLVTCTVVLALLCLAIYLSAGKEILACGIATVSLLLVPFLILLCNLINRPVELAINRYYIRDAKKILASHESLITVGVTGSYGKTSVKFMLGALLGAKYDVLVTPENYNTPLGVTKTIRNSLRATHDVFVCEMGAKHVGDIKEICDIVHPRHGIITSVGPQHLESFHTLENVQKTKFELAEALPQWGTLCVNGEDANIQSFSCPRPAVTYGFSADCDYYATNLSVTLAGTTFTVHHKQETATFKVSLIGRHNVLNLIGAIAICCELGIDLQKLPPYARKIQPVTHRLQLTRRGNTAIIDDAYNANPSGVKAAMDVLSLFDGFRIVITPGMVELGSVEYEENYKFGKLMAQVCDFVVLVGEKQTQPIYKGLTDSGFDTQKIFVAANLNEGAEKAFSLQVAPQEKIVLFENDLPDNY